MSRDKSTKLMLLMHGFLTLTLLASTIVVVISETTMGEPEQYSFFLSGNGRGALNVIFLFIAVIGFLFFVFLSYGSFTQIPFCVIFFKKAPYTYQRKLTVLSLPISLTILQLFGVLFLYRYYPMSNITLFLFVFVCFTTTYVTPALLIALTAGGFRKIYRYRDYRAFLLAQILLLSLLFAFQKGFFPELQQSLTVFFDSYSRWK